MAIINIKKGILKPSEGIHDLLVEQFYWRKYGIFEGTNTISICEPLEPVWWNRPLTSDTLCKKEADGMYSYNLPFISDREDFKTGYNLLLGKYSIAIAILIKIDPVWSENKVRTLFDFSPKAIYQSLIELGVDKERLTLKQNNDLLYDGKKFCGIEKKLKNGVFSENIVITLAYGPEKEIFARLTGELALKRGITGIEEETKVVTRENLTNKLLEKYTHFCKFLDK